MAMLNDGFELTVPANAQLKLHIQYQQVTANWENIRTHINVGENAELDLTESYDYDCRINHVSIIKAENNSRLKLQSHKLLAKTAALIHYSKITCAQNVTIEQCTTNNNATLSHSIQDVDFNGEHCSFKAASINATHGSCHIAENIQTNHFVGNCKSQVIKRSLATDKGQVALNAKAVVSVGADGSDVAQSLKNILLSDEAKIYSRPELEINTDDVIAAHGSTIGELDEQSLTYLRSRGIPKEQAKFMLIESFLQDANIFKTEDFLDRIEL
jgi:Fe-S cluster assembly protein SufD